MLLRECRFWSQRGKQSHQGPAPTPTVSWALLVPCPPVAALGPQGEEGPVLLCGKPRAGGGQKAGARLGAGSGMVSLALSPPVGRAARESCLPWSTLAGRAVQADMLGVSWRPTASLGPKVLASSFCP